jgi:serine protease Do
VLPSVVAIETRPTPVKKQATERRFSQVPNRRNPLEGTPLEDFFRDFPLEDQFQFEGPMPEMQPQQGLGSGVIIDASGLIMTNNHVVRGAQHSQITVRLQDGREFTASSVATDPKTDIAIAESRALDLVAAQLADSDQISVGDWVLALGHHLALKAT